MGASDTSNHIVCPSMMMGICSSIRADTPMRAPLVFISTVASYMGAKMQAGGQMLTTVPCWCSTLYVSIQAACACYQYSDLKATTHLLSILRA